MKRTADKSEHLSKKQKKETISYGWSCWWTFYTKHSQWEDHGRGDTTDAFCRDFIGNINLENEADFTLDMKTDNKANKNDFHSTAISDDEDDFDDIWNADQDHDNLDDADDVNIMKAQILSMVLELKKKDVLINGKANDLTITDMPIKFFAASENFALRSWDMIKFADLSCQKT